ncbi:MAG: bifunctional UDP-sugar hydrolase/5'-nucleotidase [Syntrophorhabdales bacterium]|jgi:2',3'-cyclic-nucleotide 2'-phosphodiesterase (5'-nucleotidase family)
MRKNRFVFILVAVAALFYLIVPSVLAAVTLTILHVNDLHGRVFSDDRAGRGRPAGGAAYLAAMIGAQRAANPGGVILLSAGDMFQGTPVSDLFHGRPVLEMMNEMGFDAMTLGNHEFDWGRTVLSGIMKDARFPVLSANIVDRAGRRLAGAAPYVIVERKGIKVALIGLTTPETAIATKRENVRGLTFIEPKEVLPGLIREVRQKGARLIVLLTHLGLDEDERLAAAVRGIDVIVGGHSHTVVTDPVVIGRTIIVQAGSHGLFLGVLELTIDEKTGRIITATGKDELRPVHAGQDDPADERIARIADFYREKTGAAFRKVVGESRVNLGRRSDGESTLGDVITDAMRASAGAQIAIQNSGGIRADIKAGAITMEQVYTVLPFDDVLVAMDMRGETLTRLFEKAGAMRKGMLQVSGMTVRYGRGPAGRTRVTDIRVGGAPLDASRMYRVVTNDFLATGGDGFTDFEKGRNIAYGGEMRDAFVEYLRARSPLAPREEGRIAITE